MLCCVVPAFIYIAGSAIFSGCAWLLYAFRDLFGWNTDKASDFERNFGVYDGLDYQSQGKDSGGILKDLKSRPCCQTKQAPAKAHQPPLSSTPTPKAKPHGCCAARAVAKQGLLPSPIQVAADNAPKCEAIKPSECSPVKA